MPLIEFAINDSASPLGSGYTPFYADRGQHPRRPLNPPAPPDPAVPAGAGEAAAHLMTRVTAEVRALLQERQDQRKAEHDAHRRDVRFAVGDEVLLDTELTVRAYPSSLKIAAVPALDGPVSGTRNSGAHYLPPGHPRHVTACRTCPEFNVERLRPYLRRPEHLGEDVLVPPPPVVGADGELEHEVQELLKFKMRYGRPYVLVRWAGRDASGDTWEPLDNLTNCAEAITAFEQATGRSLPRPALAPPALPGAAPAPIAPAGFSVDAAPPGDLGGALVGRTILYWWPTDGWQRGTIARLCPRGAFSHVVAYSRQTSTLRGTADSLLDAARLVRVPLGPAIPCRRRRHRPGPSGAGRAPPSQPPTITFSLVGGS